MEPQALAVTQTPQVILTRNRCVNFSSLLCERGRGEEGSRAVAALPGPAPAPAPAPGCLPCARLCARHLAALVHLILAVSL